MTIAIKRPARAGNGAGSAEVHKAGQHIATVWDTDPRRPTALFIDAGRVPADEAQAVMSGLQRQYSDRLVYVPPQKAWRAQ